MRCFDSMTRSVLIASVWVASVVAMGVWAATAVHADETARDETARVEAARVEAASDEAASDEAVRRTRETVEALDNIFKQTIVMITDKYVHDESDFAAGSAAVLLFKNISESSDQEIRLIDATGDPYDSENVAQDQFEKEGVKRLKSGAERHEQVIEKDGRRHLRVLTPVPVVMEKCVMCHAHYADAKPGEPIGAISYTVPVR